MRGNPQAASTRLLAAVPGRRWSTWLEEYREKRRRSAFERLELLERLAFERRRAARSGEYRADRMRPW
jgi:hypothetical protein